MKKLFVITLILSALLALSACESNANNAPQPDPAQTTEPSPEPLSTTPSPEPLNEEPSAEPPHEWTIEDLSATIVAAGEFWEDWWHLRGVFSWEYFDNTPWDYWVEQPDHPRSRGFDRILPTSGIESLNDIRDLLLQFYTVVWVDRELFALGTTMDEIGVMVFGSPLAFEEYDGNLYVATARAGTVRPDWATASHTITAYIENRVEVKTTVTAYDHRGIGEEMPIATFRFIFIDGRIDSGLGHWTWPEETSQPVLQTFFISHGDTLLMIDRADNVNHDDFSWLFELDHTAFWGEPGQGEELIIWATQPLYSPALIHFTNDWDDAAGQDIFILVESIGMQDALQVEQGLLVRGFTGLGTFPGSGISFYDAQGVQHFFAIQHNNSDSPFWYVIMDITEQMRFE